MTRRSGHRSEARPGAHFCHAWRRHLRSAGPSKRGGRFSVRCGTERRLALCREATTFFTALRKPRSPSVFSSSHYNKLTSGRIYPSKSPSPERRRISVAQFLLPETRVTTGPFRGRWTLRWLTRSHYSPADELSAKTTSKDWLPVLNSRRERQSCRVDAPADCQPVYRRGFSSLFLDRRGRPSAGLPVRGWQAVGQVSAN